MATAVAVQPYEVAHADGVWAVSVAVYAIPAHVQQLAHDAQVQRPYVMPEPFVYLHGGGESQLLTYRGG